MEFAIHGARLALDLTPLVCILIGIIVSREFHILWVLVLWYVRLLCHGEMCPLSLLSTRAFGIVG